MTTDPKPRLPRTEEVPLLASEQRTVEQLGGTVLLDRYRLIEPLGSGGASVVYRAEHTIMQKQMAVKILRPEHAARPDFVRRFLDEARTVARLRHENIVDVVDIGRSETGVVFCVMEWLEGEDLGTTIDREGPMPWIRAQRIVLQICRALIAAHGAGIVHRDVKPPNCFRIRRGRDRDFIKLLDFGIAKDIGATHRLTVTGAIMGTVGYMAPEQARGEIVDVRADVYAVGAIVFELLSGRPVFEGEHFLDVMVKQATEPAPRLGSIVDDLPPGLDDVVARALVRKRDERFASMAEFASAVMNIGRAARRVARRDDGSASGSHTVVAPAPADPPPAAAVRGSEAIEEGHTVIAPAPSAPMPPIVQPMPFVESWPPAAEASLSAGVGLPRSSAPLPSGPHVVPPQARPRAPAAIILVVLLVPVAIGIGIYSLSSNDEPEAAAETLATAPDPAPPSTVASPEVVDEAEPVPSEAPPATDVPAAPPETPSSDELPPVASAEDQGGSPPTEESQAPPPTPKSGRTTGRTTKEQDRSTPQPHSPSPRRRIEQRLQQQLQAACGDEHAREPHTVALARLPGSPTVVTVTPRNSILKDCITKHLRRLDVPDDFADHYRFQLKPKSAR